MNDQVAKEELQAAQAYEELHVPALFRQWTVPMLDSISAKSGNCIIDVACGTGILARQAAESYGNNGLIAGVDPAPGMLAVARRLAPSIEWRVGTAESIPYSDSVFDAVVSQFGMMFFDDRAQALREFLRVLKPGGKISVAVWDKLENSEAYPLEVELLDSLAGKRAAEALMAPFVLGDKDKLNKLFKSTGIHRVELTTHRGTARFPSIKVMVEADLRGWLPVMGVVLPEELIQEILTEAEHRLKSYVQANGEVVFEVPAHIITGHKGRQDEAER
jgi:ubiquinone/menaquinone biosynthesis C-methylase UbiE